MIAVSRTPRTPPGLFWIWFFTTWLMVIPGWSSAQDTDSPSSTESSSETRLWLLRSAALQGLSGSEGEIQSQSEYDGLAIVATDDQGQVWSFGEGVLRAHDPNGELLLETFHEDSAPAVGIKLFIDRPRGVVWLVQAQAIHRFTLEGEFIATTSVAEDVEGIDSIESDGNVVDADLDPDSGRLWVAVNYVLWAQSAEGEVETFTRLETDSPISALSYDRHHQQLWVKAGQRLRRYSPEAELNFVAEQDDVYGLIYLLADGSGALWGANSNLLVRLDSEAEVLFAGQAFPNLNIFQLFRNRVSGLALDPNDQSVWVSAQDVLNRFTVEGELQQSFDLRGGATGGYVRDLALGTAAQDSLRFSSPEDGNISNDNRPGLFLVYQGAFDPDPDTLEAFANGEELDIECEFDAESGELECELDQRLPEGEITLTASVFNANDERVEAEPVRIQIDTIEPQLTVELPTPGSRVNTSPINVVGEINEEARVLINEQLVVLDGLRFNVPQALEEEENEIRVEAIDAAGNRSVLDLEVFLDTFPPPPISADDVNLNLAAQDGIIEISAGTGSAEPRGVVVITNERTGQSVTVSVPGNGSFSAQLAAETLDRITLKAVDEVGNESEVLALRSPDNGLPPAPESVAPPLNTRVPTSMSIATNFLYFGANPIQTGVSVGTIEKRRAAVIRGRVLSADNQPLAGVTVRIHQQGQYGQTLSRRDGRFDMAVNGGGKLTVSYEKDGFLPVQRAVDVPWQDYVFADDVVMIGLDPQVTTIDLANAVTPQIAQGTLQSDLDGERQATLLFPVGTSATMTLPDGSQLPLNTLNVRATEYTVGENGPERMPGALPVTSGYTYAVELSVDEAIAAGAQRVDFSQPVPLYVDNFLDFPVGGIVPLGYYDREKAAWISSDNGRVIQILSEENGLAVLDVDGSGEAADSAALTELGINTAELQQIAALYDAGKSLWRSPIPHFTPWDCNWPYGTPPDAAPPPNTPPENPRDDDPDTEDRDECEGCIIQPQGQTVGEEIPIVATPYKLVYRSDRMEGYGASRDIAVPLSSGAVADSLRGIELTIVTAGQTFKEVFPPEPNQTFTYKWDGQEAYGRASLGDQNATVRVSYLYPATYFGPFRGTNRSFALPSGSVQRISQRGTAITRLSRDWEVGVSGRVTTQDNSIGGWTFNINHQYDPRSGTLIKGDGTIRSVSTLGNTVETVVDNDTFVAAGSGALSRLGGLVAAPDGSMYYGDTQGDTVLRIATDGSVTRIAGQSANRGFAGDGGPAIEARFNRMQDIAMGPDGSLYIADTGNRRIRRIDPAGVITTVAGGGARPYENGLPATEVDMSVGFIAVDGDGAIYLTSGHTVRKIGLDGLVETIAGQDVAGFSGDGGPAFNASLRLPSGLSLDRQGNLYITDAGNARIRRIDAQGIITTVVGNGAVGSAGDGAEATASAVSDRMIGPVVFDRNGSLYFAGANDHRIRRVDAKGVITTVAGTGEQGLLGDGGPARTARLDTPSRITADPLGNLYVTDFNNGVIRKVSLASEQLLESGEFIVASKDAREYYVFSDEAQHLRTVDAYTGAELFSFEYEETGQLLGIRDVDGRVTTISNSFGRPARITAPDGQVTQLAVNERGHLTSVVNPGLESYGMAYSDDGLLERYTDRRGLVNRFEYDDEGRLIRDFNAGGGSWQLSRSDVGDGYITAMDSAEGRLQRFSVEPQADGSRRQLTVHADETESLHEYLSPGRERIRAPDGTVYTLREGADPRFGSDAPTLESLRIQTPGGLDGVLSYQRAIALSDPTNPLTFDSIREEFSRNGQVTVSEFDSDDRQFTISSALGRVGTMQVNRENRPILQQIRGLEEVAFEYDERGHVTQITAGGDQEEERVILLDYYPEGDGVQGGYLRSVTDPLGRITRYEYDGAGRIVSQTLPGDRELRYAYDATGNLVGLQPPGRPEHRFDYNAFNLTEDYDPPAVSGVGDTQTRYRYNKDQELTRMTRPDGKVVELQYNVLGQQTRQLLPRGSYLYSYDSATGQQTGIIAPDGNRMSMSYDGFLLTDWSWSGQINGQITRRYNNDFLITSYQVNNEAPIQREYDADKLLVQAGDFGIARAEQRGGLITATNLASINTEHEYNGFAEPLAMRALVGEQGLYETFYERDALGRIVSKEEVIEGEESSESYEYDESGRLIRVERGDDVISYEYDDNDNRLRRLLNGNVVETGLYDNQDRLLNYAGINYLYNANGELIRRANNASGAATQYGYDALGNLLSVEERNGTTVTSRIDYIIDGMDRRIGKLRNGVLEQAWLYQDQVSPIAELNPDGSVKSRFIYADKRQVPSYMIRDGVTYRILSDHIGSPRLVVNAQTGEVVQRMDYDTFGQVIRDTNPRFQPFGYAGGLYDQDTGLVRFGARDYDPQTGRWISKDPIRFNGGVNLYGYTFNDPVNAIDIDGRIPLPVITGAIGAAINAYGAYVNGGSVGEVLAAGVYGFVDGAMAGPSKMAHAIIDGAIMGIWSTVASHIGKGKSLACLKAGDIGYGIAAGIAGGMLANLTGLNVSLGQAANGAGLDAALAAGNIAGAAVGATTGVAISSAAAAGN